MNASLYRSSFFHHPLPPVPPCIVPLSFTTLYPLVPPLPRPLVPLVRSKVVMRWTVVLSDFLVFFPAAIAFVSTFHASQPRGAKTWLLSLLLLQPGLILIDHGHFQVCRGHSTVQCIKAQCMCTTILH